MVTTIQTITIEASGIAGCLVRGTLTVEPSKQKDPGAVQEAREKAEALASEIDTAIGAVLARYRAPKPTTVGVAHVDI